MASTRSYKHRLVVPDLPAPGDYSPLFEDIFESGWFTNFGPLVQRFERSLADLVCKPSETCVTACSATAGLTAALIASGRTGRVLVPAFTFPASMGAVRAAGLTPIVADVDLDSWALQRRDLEAALAATNAQAVMLVTPFGIGRCWDAELEICRQRGVAVVIDNASGLGGARLGSAFGRDVFEVFSMHATKPFAVGEGGLVVAHRDHDEGLRAALNFALERPANPSLPAWGINGKMSEFHAAIGIAQLRRFPARVAQRRAFANVYAARLAENAQVVAPRDIAAAPWQFYPVLLPSSRAAERLISIAAELGVEVRRYYRPSLSHWPGVELAGSCPSAEALAERMCVLPVRALEADADREIFHLVFTAIDRALAAT